MNTTSAVSDVNSYSNVYNTTSVAKTQTENTSFSDVLTSALQDQLTQQTISLTSQISGSSVGGYDMTASAQTIESLVLGAAASGEMSDIKMAILMLCMMMQGSGSSSDLSPVMSMLASMLTQLDTDTGELRDDVLNSPYSPQVLSTIDSQVFLTANPPAISGTDSAIVPSQAWIPVSPAIVSREGERTPETLRAVIDQFSVESSERYRPYRYGRDTYCNIFLWDVTSALGCEIPHFVDLTTGNPRQYPDISGANELDAEGVEWWLVNYGQQYGWREVDARTAQEYANQGKAAVTTAGSIGHVQVVCPSQNGGYDPILGVSIAQSGSKNIAYTHISSIYSAGSMSKIRYFVHE